MDPFLGFWIVIAVSLAGCVIGIIIAALIPGKELWWKS
jgi:uncharacterized protein (DUF2062 family)